MQRLVAILAVSAAALGAQSLPVAAADYNAGLRGSYPMNWGFSNPVDPVGFEAGIRYWYALGTQSFDAGGYGVFSSSDTAHILEKYFKIEDYSTETYVKAYAGFAGLIDGTYSTPTEGGTLTDGHIYYFVGDFGWMPWALGQDDSAFSLGGLGGYMYWNDSPDTGYTNFFDPDSVTWDPADGSPIIGVGDSVSQDLTIHAIRLGLTASGEMGPLSIDAEAAAIPYAWVNGSLGANNGFNDSPCDPPAGNCGLYSASATTIDGHAFGATAEITAGMTVLNDWNLKVGGRAWYLAGVGNAAITVAEIIDATDDNTNTVYGEDGEEGTVSVYELFDSNGVFSVMRFGGLIELSKSF